jgi:hypothetical protein
MKSQRTPNRTILRCLTTLSVGILLFGYLSEVEGQDFEIRDYVVLRSSG